MPSATSWGESARIYDSHICAGDEDRSAIFLRLSICRTDKASFVSNFLPAYPEIVILIGPSFSGLGDGVALDLSEDLDIMSREALVTTLGLHTRFPEEHKAWESSKREIGNRFQQILSQRRTEIHAKIERESEEVGAEVEEVVVSELLNLFP